MTPARESPAPIAGNGDRAADEALRTEHVDARAGTASEPAALPVLASRPPAAVAGRTSRVLSRDGEPRSLPAVQAAAVAAGSFVAGAAVAGLVHRRARGTRALAQGSRDGAATRVGRALSRSSRKGNRAGAARAGHELVQIVGSRTLLVDVHLLGVPDSDR